MAKKIEPKILKGFRDFEPTEMAKRQFIIDLIRMIFEMHGYQGIETPALEYTETLMGKYSDENDKLMYSFKDHGNRQIGLRYDHTVSTARFVAMNWSKITMPFKRYTIGNVWRADNPQKGRFREFMQVDADIIGTDSLMADAEMINLLYTVYSALEFKDFVIRINSRKLTEAFFDKAKIKKSDRKKVITIIDKLDKISMSGVVKELSEFLKPAQVEYLSDSMLSEKVRSELDQLPAGEAKKEMEELFAILSDMQIPDENIMLDTTLARGAAYYTGPIFEMVIPESGFGSFGGGGRYDDLTSLYSNKNFSGTGISFGIDRMMLYLDEQKKLDEINSAPNIMIANFKETRAENFDLMFDLQEAGLYVEIYPENSKLDKQFKYANKKEIPFVILQGADEVKKKQVLLRNMQTGEQKAYKIPQLIKTLCK